MRRNLPLLLVVSAFSLAGCEDGPEKIFSPFEGDPKPQNGLDDKPGVFVQDGEKKFDDIVGDDSVETAKFCDETELDELIEWMVTQPVIPDVSAGGIPMWSEDGGQLHADELVGPRSEGKFCNPTGIYLDAYTWGPTDEVIVFFDEETKLVDGVIAYQQYLGTMEGDYTDPVSGDPVHVIVKPRERLNVGGQEYDRYASRVDAPNQPNSWLNPVNVTKLYRMVRETFFGADPLPEDFDCVAEQLCDLIYTTGNESVPQDTFILIQDSGIQIRFTPEGQAIFIYLTPVRSAPFENGADIAFGATGSLEMDFGFQSTLRQNCTINLDDELTWMGFQQRCIASGDERALDRVNYNVDTSRDAVAVEFNGIDLHFLRNTRQNAVFRDGERPSATDKLYAFAFTRTSPAIVDEFRPRSLGLLYKERLEQRIKDSVAADCVTDPMVHPLCSFTVGVPFINDDAQRIGELLRDNGESWIPQVIANVENAVANLTPAERELVDDRLLDHVFLIEPFVDSVMYAFSHGESDGPDAWKVFRTTDDRRWSIGYAHFTRNDVKYRLNVQYSLNFGAVTYVIVERGVSEIDNLIDIAHRAAGSAGPYYEIGDALAGTILSLGGDVIQIDGFDRQLGTLDLLIEESIGDDFELEIAGDPIQDLAGYNRQIRGERFEFVPANELLLYGKETIMIAWIREDGTIGRINQGLFKGELELCPGLPILYGDNVPAKLQAWEATVTPNEYRDCEIVFNYSENGNVLDSIASISNRRSFVVVDGRAATASVWE